MPIVALAYVIAPLIALTVAWLFWIVPSLMGPPFALRQALAIWLSMAFVGGAMCLVVELVIITPVLVAFRRYRWPWLNGWVAAASGLLIGLVLALAYGSLPPSPGYSESGQYGIVYITNGHRTLAGWKNVFMSSLLPATVGLISAVVFRLIAVQTVSNDPAR